MNYCPNCGEALRLGKREKHSRLVSRYRSCACGFKDKAFYEPEQLVRTEKVRSRTKCTVSDIASTTTTETIQECKK